MCINCCLIVSVILIVNTQTNLCANATGYSKSFLSKSISNFHNNGLVVIPPVFLEGNKRAIHRDIKNYKDRKIRHWVSTTGKPLNKPQILPKIPSFYLEPPSTVKHYWNEKLKKNLLRERLRNNLTTNNFNTSKNHEEVRLNYVRDHDPLVSQHKIHQTTETEGKKKEKFNENDSNKKNRVDFHIHGHQGPDSYVFGYDTGSGKNRQFRFEEKHENGTVTGHYGYYDARGKLRKIYYTSDPATGYEANTNGH